MSQHSLKFWPFRIHEEFPEKWDLFWLKNYDTMFNKTLKLQQKILKMHFKKASPPYDCPETHLAYHLLVMCMGICSRWVFCWGRVHRMTQVPNKVIIQCLGEEIMKKTSLVIAQNLKKKTPIIALKWGVMIAPKWAMPGVKLSWRLDLIICSLCL